MAISKYSENQAKAQAKKRAKLYETIGRAVWTLGGALLMGAGFYLVFMIIYVLG